MNTDSETKKIAELDHEQNQLCHYSHRTEERAYELNNPDEIVTLIRTK